MNSYRKLIEEAVRYERSAFDQDLPVNGGDLVDWFGRWRIRAMTALSKNSKRSHTARRKSRS